jgi:hypothetical protein
VSPATQEGPGQQPRRQPQAGSAEGGGLLARGEAIPAEEVEEGGGNRLARGRTAPSQPPRMLVERTGIPRPSASTIRPPPTTIATCRPVGPRLG